MASSYMTFSMEPHYQQIFYSQQELEENGARNDDAIEPHLLLSLRSEVDVEGQIMTHVKESRHRFVECNSFFLSAFIQEHEPLPSEILMKDADRARESISREIFHLVCGSIGVSRLRWLHAEIVYRVYEEWEDQNDDVVLRDRRMAMTQSDCSALGEEVCAVCLDEIGGGGKAVIRTPCGHRIHGRCVARWFENSGVCPLCRTHVGP